MIFIKRYWRINPNKKRKILIVFDAMIADMLTNKKLNPIVSESFTRERKLNTSFVFITKSYCAKKHYIEFHAKNWELQQIALNHSSDIDFKDSMNLYKKCTARPYSFWVIDATLASDNL